MPDTPTRQPVDRIHSFEWVDERKSYVCENCDMNIWAAMSQEPQACTPQERPGA